MNTVLTEIKKGQTGTGLLIENDGYISLNSKENKTLKESLESNENGVMNIPNPFIVSAVFQKYGVENANGRIYPEDILKREVEKYQQAIKEKRAYGECYTPDAMCLTENGWKMLSDVQEGDKVLSLNVKTKEIEIKSVIRKISHSYNGKMIRIKGRHINDLVTPEHNFPIFGRNGNFKGVYSANDILNNLIPDMSHSSLYKNGEWTAKGDNIFTLKGLDKCSNATLKKHPYAKDDVEIPMSTFMKFLGIYLSEGHYCKKNNDVVITQKKENICSLIEELLYELGLNYRISERKNKIKDYHICDPRLHKYVEQFGNCYTKFIPTYIKSQSKENLRLLYDWFVLGDGRIRGDKRRNKKLSDDVFSSSKQLIYDLNEIQLKIGYNGSFHMEKRDNNRIIEGRVIKGENCHEMYFSLRSLSKNVWIEKRFLTVEEENYNGDVMCIEVEDNHNWYVMSNGKCHWTNNCNHPESSAIDVGRIAMNIVELHWVGRTLVGKIEIPITEGFRKFGFISCFADMVAHWILSGLKIGVSSRALGSVKQVGGVLMVGDDLELVCWDVVSQPSTPNAWITTSDEELQPYVENKQSTKPIITEDKFSKFNEWLND